MKFHHFFGCCETQTIWIQIMARCWLSFENKKLLRISHGRHDNNIWTGLWFGFFVMHCTIHISKCNLLHEYPVPTYTCLPAWPASSTVALFWPLRSVDRCDRCHSLPTIFEYQIHAQCSYIFDACWTITFLRLKSYFQIVTYEHCSSSQKQYEIALWFVRVMCVARNDGKINDVHGYWYIYAGDYYRQQEHKAQTVICWNFTLKFFSTENLHGNS